MQEFFEITTKLPVKLNNPVIDVGTLLYVSTFTKTLEIRFFINVEYDEI
jgi:hypothetical protein